MTCRTVSRRDSAGCLLCVSSLRHCLLPAAYSQRFDRTRHRRRFSRRLPGRGRRRQRRQEARHRRRGREHLCLVREPDLEEADRHDREADARHHLAAATADLDGDGKAEIAIAYEFAMNEPTPGQAPRWRCREGARRSLEARPDRRYRQHPPASLGRHQRRQAARPGRGADLRTRGQTARSTTTGTTSRSSSPTAIRRLTPGTQRLFCEYPVIHAIEVRRCPRRRVVSVVLTADNEGVIDPGRGHRSRTDPGSR